MACCLVIVGAWQHQIILIIVIKKHHFFSFSTLTVIIVFKSSMPSCVILVLCSVLILAVFLKLFKLICVCGTNELAIHIEDLSLWVH